MEFMAYSCNTISLSEGLNGSIIMSISVWEMEKSWKHKTESLYEVQLQDNDQLFKDGKNVN